MAPRDGHAREDDRGDCHELPVVARARRVLPDHRARGAAVAGPRALRQPRHRAEAAALEDLLHRPRGVGAREGDPQHRVGAQGRGAHQPVAAGARQLHRRADVAGPRRHADAAEEGPVPRLQADADAEGLAHGRGPRRHDRERAPGPEPLRGLQQHAGVREARVGGEAPSAARRGGRHVAELAPGGRRRQRRVVAELRGAPEPARQERAPAPVRQRGRRAGRG
mmetsp:Transcript_25117/g.70816  ORF Transcript_25117/g.70816 Transcript_25117/m.70816 type:complete len:223 (-) Transcript_25117:911-1579(-)